MCLYNPHLKFQITNRVLLILQIDICLKSADCVPDPDCPTNNNVKKNRKKVITSSRFPLSDLQRSVSEAQIKKEANTQPKKDIIISPELSIDDSQCTNSGGTLKIDNGILSCLYFKQSSAQKPSGTLHIMILQLCSILLYINKFKI